MQRRKTQAASSPPSPSFERPKRIIPQLSRKRYSRAHLRIDDTRLFIIVIETVPSSSFPRLLFCVHPRVIAIYRRSSSSSSSSSSGPSQPLCPFSPPVFLLFFFQPGIPATISLTQARDIINSQEILIVVKDLFGPIRVFHENSDGKEDYWKGVQKRVPVFSSFFFLQLTRLK